MYEKNHGGETPAEEGKPGGSKRKSTTDVSEGPKSKSAKKPDTRHRGFARGLTVEKVIGASNEPGELYFVIKWKGSDELDLVPAKEANLKIPQALYYIYIFIYFLFICVLI